MPGGAWTIGDVTNPATRPGAYFNLISQAIALIGDGQAGTVAIIGRSDWGPVNEFTEVGSEAAVRSRFGTNGSIPKLANQAIRGGASTVKILRIAGSSVATADVVLDDDSSDPEPALTLTALYPGARGNAFRITVAANPIGGFDLSVYEGGVLLEQFTTTSGTNTQFAAEVTARSQFLTAAVEGTENRVLGAVSNVPLAGGDSGDSVVAGDYTAAQALAIQESFDVIVMDDEDDETIQDAAVAWAQDARVEGSRFILVMGSAAGMSLEDAMARARSIDHEGVVYVYPGFEDADGVSYTGQEAAARVAGLIAAAGISRSITFAPIIGGVEVERRLTNSEVREALTAGLTTLVYDGQQVSVEKGINTLTTITDEKPLSFSRIRTIVVLDAVQNGLAAGLRGLVGQVNNDDDGRATILGAAQSFLDQLIQGRALKPGAFVELDPEMEQIGDSIFLRVGVTPLDSIEKVFVTVYVSAA
jgi:hypothetical protein